MRTPLLIILYLVLSNPATSQVSFSNIEFKLIQNADQTGTNLTCTGSSFSLGFRLKSATVKKIQDPGFISIDSQLVQIAPLKVEGSKKELDSLSEQEQKEFLTDYSKYELEYFAKELNIEVINPNSQWVDANSRKWLVWYFRVGKVPVSTDKKTEIQLFATTIVGKQILSLNAPIQGDGDFRKAALIINQMMESLTVNAKN
jgi:hypothetical protein